MFRFTLGAMCALALSGCFGRGGATSALAPVKAAPVRRDVAGLGKIISLPRPPLEVAWQYTQTGDGQMGPSDFQLQAVMKFAPRDVQFILNSAGKRGALKGGEVKVEDWFPAALRTKTQNLLLPGVEFEPNSFRRGSLQNGEAFHVKNTNYIVVSLLTT